MNWESKKKKEKFAFCIFLGSQEEEEEEERNETDGNDKKLIGQQTIDTSSIKYKIY
jgi:hypothetical protein